MSSQQRYAIFAQWIVRKLPRQSAQPRRPVLPATEPGLPRIPITRCLGGSLLGLVLFQLGCFSTGVSSLSGVSAPATRLAPTDPSTLAAPINAEPTTPATRPNPSVGSALNRARSTDDQTGLLVPPLPHDLPPIPINREAN